MKRRSNLFLDKKRIIKFGVWFVVGVIILSLFNKFIGRAYIYPTNPLSYSEIIHYFPATLILIGILLSIAIYADYSDFKSKNRRNNF